MSDIAACMIFSIFNTYGIIKNTFVKLYTIMHISALTGKYKCLVVLSICFRVSFPAVTCARQLDVRYS